MKKSQKFFCSLLIFFAITFSAHADNKITEWKFSFGDRQEWASPGFDDSKWTDMQIPASFELDKNEKYFWLRTVLEIPESASRNQLWLQTGRLLPCFELYANGSLIARKGVFPPEYRSGGDFNNIYLIPSGLYSDGKIDLAIRFYHDGSHADLLGFSFEDDKKAFNVQYFQKFFNMELYLILSVLCLFIGSYFIMQFISMPKDFPSLYYSLSLIFIAIYFFDMGTEYSFFNSLLQRAVGKSSLSISVGFLLMFFAGFFAKKHRRKINIFAIIVMVVITVLQLLSYKNDRTMRLLFNISLLPIFSYIIYITVIVLSECRKKNRDAVIFFIGIATGLVFAIHDIVYQVINIVPFAWLQGITFFSIHLSVFIAMSASAARTRKELGVSAIAVKAQHEKLSDILARAEKLSKDTASIAIEMENSVIEVAKNAASSASDAREISQSVENQNQSLWEANEAVNGLLESLERVNHELKKEFELLDSTTESTKRLVSGFDSVAEGIEGAANFAFNLDSMTRLSLKNIEELVATIDKVNNSSSEILEIVKVVNEFAEQTNLLAMNASIEAAHAGTYGKGFAVIAMEIKKLAGASSEHSSRINEIVKAISASMSQGQKASINVMEAINSISLDAGKTAASAKEASDESQQQRNAGAIIAVQAEELGRSASSVRAESQKQSEFSEKVSESMSVLAGSSEMVGASAIEISNKGIALSSSAEALRELAGRMRKASEELSALITRH